MHFVSVKEKEHFYELYKQMGITLDVKTKWVIFDDIYFEVASCSPASEIFTSYYASFL